jgi:DNA ligase-1
MKLAPLAINPAGWMASEKLDGCQAIADSGRLRSRHGRAFAAPGWFVQGLPPARLHGELWAGRGTFPELVGMIQRKGGDWHGIKFCVFDCDLPGGFAERMATLATMPLPEHCAIVPQRTIRNAAEVDRWENEVVAGGGEGLVLRRPCAEFRPGHGVVKVKRLHADLNRSALD